MILKNNSGLTQIPLVIITACLFTVSLLSIPAYFFNQSISKHNSVLGLSRTNSVNIGYTNPISIGYTKVSNIGYTKPIGVGRTTPAPTRKPISTPISHCIPLKLFGCSSNRPCCSGICVNYQCITPKSVGTSKPANIGRT